MFVRNNDVEHEYRQDSDFFYLTGFDEPESVVVLDAKERKTILFVRPRDRDREVWDGPRAGVDGAQEQLRRRRGVRHRRPRRRSSRTCSRTAGAFTTASASTAASTSASSGRIDRVRARSRTGVFAPTEIVDPGAILHEMRLRKSPVEVETMRAAARITREAHERAMARARPGMREYEVEALLLDTFRRHGSERPAYGSIVGSGPNACVLHYRKNDRRIEPGDLLLIDAGCEYGYYASDVTRTFPVGRAFSPRAAGHLRAGARGAARRHRGVAGRARRSTRFTPGACEVITRGLVRLGLLTGERGTSSSKRELTSASSCTAPATGWAWMCTTSGPTSWTASRGPSRPGMVLTVEPGIYIAPDEATVPAAWRGIGVRIEDDVLVTASDPEVLTSGIPKTVDEVHRACAS